MKIFVRHTIVAKGNNFLGFPSLVPGSEYQKASLTCHNKLQDTYNHGWPCLRISLKLKPQFFKQQQQKSRIYGY